MALIYNYENLNKIEELINIIFKDKIILQCAITHKSFSNENKHLNLSNNERLEFLGDSVLSIIISTNIFKHFPDYPEGELAKMRAVLVSEPVLADLTRNLNISNYILMGKGEELTGGRDRDSILADTMEALIGALYLDQGLEITSKFVIKIFKDDIKAVEEGKHIQDYKSMLQEIVQRDNTERPEYRVADEKGPDHNKTFLIEVNLNNKKIGLGQGSSKKEAEQNAAKAALNNLGEL